MGLISRVSSRTYRNLKKPYQKNHASLVKKLNTKRSDWCKPQTPSSWMLNAQTASKSEPSLATPVRRRLPRMQQHHEQTYWWQSSIDFWLQLPKEAEQVSFESNLKHAKKQPEN